MEFDVTPYDLMPDAYADFARKSFSWHYIEQPAFDQALASHYENGENIRVLDIGCGSGRVIEHLIDRGIPARNITGLDSSNEMIKKAAENLPQEVGLVLNKAAEMPFSDDSFHLVVANMVLHAMDRGEVELTFKRIGEVLLPGGDFFFVDVSPVPDLPINDQRSEQTPWGADVIIFNHDMDTLLNEMAPNYGLECIEERHLTVEQDGLAADPSEYARYTTGHFRMAALLQKTEA